MFLMFGIGIVVGVMLVIALLSTTMSTDPTGCVVILGTIILLFFCAIVFLPWLIFGG